MKRTTISRIITFVRIFIFATMILLPSISGAADPKLIATTDIVKTIWAEGEKIGYPETMLAIATQETKLGTYKDTNYGIVGDTKASFGDRSYGLCQVKLLTARAVLKRHPEFGKFTTNEHLLVALIGDDEFNVRIAAAYFKMMIDRFDNWRQAIVAYNAGPSNAIKGRDPQNYANKIGKIIRQNRAHGFVDKG